MDDHISFAYDLEGRALEDNEAIGGALRDDAPAWLHLAADHPDTPDWVDTHLGWLDPAIREALTEQQTRPRAVALGQGVLLILRGMNFNEGADPEDMVSLRIYADPARIVSLSRRPLRSVSDVEDQVAAGDGPKNAAGLIRAIVSHLTDRIEAHTTDLEGRADELEAAVIALPRGDYGGEATDQRLELAELRRFLPAQRDALRDLGRIDAAWLSDQDRRFLSEEYDQMIRVVETLEAVREQLVTISSEIDAARDERLNRNLYVLSVISAVFLPLGFLTGLMGINIAGMPGTEWQPAFWTFVAFLIVVTGGVLGALKLMRVL